MIAGHNLHSASSTHREILTLFIAQYLQVLLHTHFTIFTACSVHTACRTWSGERPAYDE